MMKVALCRENQTHPLPGEVIEMTFSPKEGAGRKGILGRRKSMHWQSWGMRGYTREVSHGTCLDRNSF